MEQESSNKKNQSQNIPKSSSVNKYSKKSKKLQRKYQDQDDEDRALKMLLLGKKKPQTTTTIKNVMDLLVDDKNRNHLDQSKVKITEQTIVNPMNSENVHSKSSHLKQIVAADVDGEGEGEEGKIMKKHHHHQEEELKQSLADENLEQSGYDLLSSLTGMPKIDAGDVLLFAIPVCAPFVTLRSYKYKVKLLPGNLQRGKAGRMIQNQFMIEAAIASANSEKDLIKQIPDNVIVEAMLGNVKPVLPALNNNASSSSSYSSTTNRKGNDGRDHSQKLNINKKK